MLPACHSGHTQVVTQHAVLNPAHTVYGVRTVYNQIISEPAVSPASYAFQQQHNSKDLQLVAWQLTLTAYYLPTCGKLSTASLVP